MNCPMCKAAVLGPEPVENVIARIGPSTMEGRILKAVHAGKGTCVEAAALFDAMFADDINGGPTEPVMYLQLNRAMARLKEALDDTGIAISYSRRRGYRICLEGQRIDRNTASTERAGV